MHNLENKNANKPEDLESEKLEHKHHQSQPQPNLIKFLEKLLLKK